MVPHPIVSTNNTVHVPVIIRPVGNMPSFVPGKMNPAWLTDELLENTPVTKDASVDEIVVFVTDPFCDFADNMMIGMSAVFILILGS